MRYSNLPSPNLSLSFLVVVSHALTPSSNNDNPSLSLLNLTADPPIHCLRLTDPPDLPELHTASCLDQAIVSACTNLLPPPPYPGPPLPPPPRDQWVWSDPLPRSQSCALGWYLPEMVTAPRHLKCKYMLQIIVHQCAPPFEFNPGGINVETIPSVTGEGTAIDTDGVRYMMAPVQLTHVDR